jgi:hypothetical protein
MKKKSNNLMADVLNSNDFSKNDRVEWLKQLYAEWLEKRRFILSFNMEDYLINEPDEFETEGYWHNF